MPATTSKPAIRIAITDDERAAAYRLRYELYVEDQGLFRDRADHENRWLVEDVDAHSTILIAEHEGEIVGTNRMTFAADVDYSAASRDEYGFDHWQGVLEEEDLSTVSRLLIRPQYRGGDLGQRLLHAGFSIAAERGAEVILGSCELHLINYYRKLGFRPVGELYDHPENGVLVRVAVMTGDLDYYQRMGSPMLSAMTKRTRPNTNLPAILRRELEGRSVTSRALMNFDAYRSLIEQCLADGRAVPPTFLDALNAEEARTLLAQSHVLDASAGDHLVLEGHLTRLPYILLSGSLEIRDRDGRRSHASVPGTLLGEVAFMAEARRPSDMVAGPEGARLLVLSDRVLKAIFAEESSLAAKFLGFMARQLCDKLLERTDPVAMIPADAADDAAAESAMETAEARKADSPAQLSAPAAPRHRIRTVWAPRRSGSESEREPRPSRRVRGSRRPVRARLVPFWSGGISTTAGLGSRATRLRPSGPPR